MLCPAAKLILDAVYILPRPLCSSKSLSHSVIPLPDSRPYPPADGVTARIPQSKRLHHHYTLRKLTITRLSIGLPLAESVSVTLPKPSLIPLGYGSFSGSKDLKGDIKKRTMPRRYLWLRKPSKILLLINMKGVAIAFNK